MDPSQCHHRFQFEYKTQHNLHLGSDGVSAMLENISSCAACFLEELAADCNLESAGVRVRELIKRRRKQISNDNIVYNEVLLVRATNLNPNTQGHVTLSVVTDCCTL